MGWDLFLAPEVSQPIIQFLVGHGCHGRSSIDLREVALAMTVDEKA